MAHSPFVLQSEYVALNISFNNYSQVVEDFGLIQAYPGGTWKRYNLKPRHFDEEWAVQHVVGDL
jgi:hypothetical protein